MRTRKRRLYVWTESTYGTDPDADGSDYVQVPALEIGDLKDGLELLETGYLTGRAHARTAPIPGRDGWSFDVTVPLIGLATAAGDGVSTSTVAGDWLDVFLDHIFGAGTDTVGEGVGAGSGANTLVIDTLQATHLNQNIVAVWEATFPTAGIRTQLAMITANGASTTLTTAPAWEHTPTTGAMLYGNRWWAPDDDGGASLCFTYVMDNIGYTLLGGRCTAASIKMESPGKIWKMSMTFSGDTKTYADLSTAGQKQSLDMMTATATTPVKGMLSPVWHGTTQYAVSSIEIDLGISAAEVGSTAATNGRAGYESISLAPTVKVTPLYTNAIANLKRNATAGRLLIQMGSGVLSGSTINCMAFACEQAVAHAADHTDDNGMVRQSVEFKVCDAVNFDASTASRIFQIARI